MFHINPRKTPWRRFGRRETIMTYEKPFLIRIKKIVKIILKTNNNLESWVTTTTFLLEFHAEANQSKFLKFYPLLKYLKPLKHMDSVSSCWHRSSLGITVMYSISKVHKAHNSCAYSVIMKHNNILPWLQKVLGDEKLLCKRSLQMSSSRAHWSECLLGCMILK